MDKSNSHSDSSKIEKNLDLLKDFKPTKYNDWKEQVIKDLKGSDFNETLKTLTYEQLELQPIYTKNDLNNLKIVETKTTQHHFNKGNINSGNAMGDWEIAQSIPTVNPDKFRELLNSGLNNGQNSIILDEYINKFSANGNLEYFLADTELDSASLNLICGDSIKNVIQKIESLFDKQGLSLQNIHGGIFSSPIANIIRRGKVGKNFDKLIEELYTESNILFQKNKNLKTIIVDASLYSNAGSNAVQDLAFSIASGSEYIFRLLSLGGDVNQIASQISFKYGIGPFYFMEIAKLRAARILWSKILKEYGADIKISSMHIFAQTSYYNLTTRDIHNNILRGTTEAFSAIIGGADVIDVTPFDAHISEANEFSLHLSRNIQNILKEESHLDKVVDAGGGSYFIENLTEELCRKAWKLFQEVESNGGIIECLKSNFIQNSIEKVNNERINDFKTNKSILVGVNKFVNEKETDKSEIDYGCNSADATQEEKEYDFIPIACKRAARQIEINK